MRRTRSRLDEELDAVDVVLEEDEADDEFLELLRQIALEAIALRATSPGDPRTEAADDVPPDPREHAGAGRARRLWERRRLRWATVALVVVAASVVPGVLESRQSAARLAALTASPAVLGPATGPPVEVWRIPGRIVSGRTDVLLVADASTGSLHRVDPATGEVIWTASPTAGEVAGDGRCFTVGEGPDTVDADLVACVAERRGLRGPGGATAQVELAVVEVDSGRVQLALAGEGALVTAEPVGRDLLFAVALPDGRLRAARWDLAAGVPLWDYLSAGRVLGSDAATGHDVERRPDSLTVGSVALDLRTGEELDAEEARRTPLRYEEHALPGGARATWAWWPDGLDGRGEVTWDGPGRVFPLPGPPLPPAITDGSQARTLLAMTADGKRLRGLDLRTGRTRWSHPAVSGSPVRATAQVAGVTLLDDGATVTAIEVSSGDSLWSAPVSSGVAPGPAMTDGELVLLPVRGGDSAVWLVARRLADGGEVWRTRTIPASFAFTVVDHRLVASVGDDVVGLAFTGWP